MTGTRTSTGGTDVARIANSSTTRTSPRAAITAKLDHPVAEKVRQNHEERLADIEKALVASPPSQSKGVFLGRQFFNGKSGTYTPTIGTRIVSIRMVGGGGGGGGVGIGAGGAAVGGGGNSGWFIELPIVGVSAIAGGVYTCGAGGAGGSTAGGAGGTGGDTTLVINGVMLIAKGGTGGSGNVRTAGNTVGGPGFPAAQPTSFGTLVCDVATFVQGGLGMSIGGVVFWAGTGAMSPLGQGTSAVGGSQNGIGGGIGAGGGGASGSAAVQSGGAGGPGAIVIEEYA